MKKETYLQFRTTEDEKELILNNMRKQRFRSFSEWARIVLMNCEVEDETNTIG
ncbi:hypothetical protein HOD38_00090 [archaeon]|mgnify:CR=1|jgi:hypothetical protein|nr:hypothetical protein [archaeon]MBT4396645.1 hypothetical protein [archaeon]MBT4441255.1 hypothetical protein [archaeon]